MRCAAEMHTSLSKGELKAAAAAVSFFDVFDMLLSKAGPQGRGTCRARRDAESRMWMEEWREDQTKVHWELPFHFWAWNAASSCGWFPLQVQSLFALNNKH